MSPLYLIGYYGPIYLFVMGLVLAAVFGGFKLVSLFIAWQYLSHVSNYVLKALIRQPRPAEANGDGLEQLHDYGMPSGHAQAAMSLFVFINSFALSLLGQGQGHGYGYYAVYTLLALTFIIVAFTCVQRVVYRRHTVPQVFAGSLVGVLSGYLFLMLLKYAHSATAINNRNLL